jgi:hypothetical protein
MPPPIGGGVGRRALFHVACCGAATPAGAENAARPPAQQGSSRGRNSAVAFQVMLCTHKAGTRAMHMVRILIQALPRSSPAAADQRRKREILFAMRGIRDRERSKDVKAQAGVGRGKCDGMGREQGEPHFLAFFFFQPILTRQTGATLSNIEQVTT